MTTTTQPDATASGTFHIGGTTPVARLGYGAMQITGDGVWGPPADHDGAVRTVRRAVELGVTLIDTANSYGPYVSEEIIREALHPYADDVVVATKAGLTRTGPGVWLPVGRPEYLQQELEMSLRRLGRDTLDLWQLHRVDEKVPADEQYGALKDAVDSGKVKHVGLSEVSVEQIEAARKIVPIATVQNMYNLTSRDSEDVLDYCEREGIGFIPWFPIASGQLAQPGGPVDEIAERTGATHAQVALAWLLRRSPVMLPIPGTKTAAHVEENIAAASVELTDDDVASLTAARA